MAPSSSALRENRRKKTVLFLRTYMQLHVYFEPYDIWIVKNALTQSVYYTKYLPAYCTEQSPPKEVNGLSASQEIPRISTQ